MAEWISVKDRLPERCVPVITCQIETAEGFEKVRAGYYLEKGKWFVFAPIGCPMSKVTHWMPLPEPPKGALEKRSEENV